MGADGDTSAYAWYRTMVQPPAAGTYSLQFSDAGDWLAVFVNGQRVSPTETDNKISRRTASPASRAVTVTLKAGENTLAALTAHYGRDKLFNHLGPVDTVDVKGISGVVTLSRGAAGRETVRGWKWKAVPNGEASISEYAGPDVDTSGKGWQTLAKPDQDVFDKKRGFAWFRATLPAVPGPHRRLHFEGVDDNATVFLNGQKIGTHQGWNSAFTIAADSTWRENGPNQLAVLVENTDNTGGIPGAVEVQTVHAGDETEVRGWQMRGNVFTGRNPGRGRGWQPVTSSNSPAVPAFYRADFTTSPPKPTGAHPILRVAMQGMSRGFVWLNGHNLGRYPEKVPVDGLYLPECWLRNGRNSLVIFDEEGNKPANVRLWVETAASRSVLETSVTTP